MGLEGVVTECHGRPAVVLKGEADRSTTSFLRQLFAEASGQGNEIVLDLTGLTFSDGSLVAALLDTLGQMPASGSLSVLHAQVDVKRLLNLGGVLEDQRVKMG